MFLFKRLKKRYMEGNKAISMTIKQICKSKHIICSVPDGRKAKAVKECLELPVSNLYPASVLQLHPECTYFLDESSSAFLSVQKGLAGNKIFNGIKA